MTTTTQNPQMSETAQTTQVHRVYIKATPQAIWDAITKPEWIAKYGYGGHGDLNGKPGESYQLFTSDAMKAAGKANGFDVPDVAIDGEIVESDPPNKLVLTWRMAMDDAMKAEGFTRLTYEIQESPGGVSRLTLIHDLAGAPGLAMILRGDLEDTGAGGGWPWVLSSLKTLLETGESMDDLPR